MTARPRPRYALSRRTRSGNSWRQGTHQVAQKFTRTTLPFCFPIASARPFASSSPERRGASAAEERLGERDRAAARAALATQRVPLRTLDRAAEGLGLGH